MFTQHQHLDFYFLTKQLTIPPSAGCGRSGVYIVIDSMLERIKHLRTIDVYGHVTCLRCQRNFMVQTEEQYVFIHRALIQAIKYGNTEIPTRNFKQHLERLQAKQSFGLRFEYQVRVLDEVIVSDYLSIGLEYLMRLSLVITRVSG